MAYQVGRIVGWGIVQEEQSDPKRPQPKFATRLLIGFLMILVGVGIYAFLVGSSVGTETGPDGETIINYVPTRERQIEVGLSAFISMFIPACAGAFKGYYEKLHNRLPDWAQDKGD